MTPKEKAKSLIIKYSSVEIPYEDGDCGGYINIPTDEAKECAILCVEEILNETDRQYWHIVKEEIEKL